MERETLTDVLRQNPWFQALEPQHFQKLAEMAGEATWDEGETIFRQGDPDDNLYLILRGQVALEIHVPGQGNVTFLTVGPSELFGWSAVTPVVGMRTAGARAVTATRAVAFNSQALREACEEDPALGYRVYRRLANVIAGRLTATRLQLINMYAVNRE